MMNIINGNLLSSLPWTTKVVETRFKNHDAFWYLTSYRKKPFSFSISSSQNHVTPNRGTIMIITAGHADVTLMFSSVLHVYDSLFSPWKMETKTLISEEEEKVQCLACKQSGYLSQSAYKVINSCFRARKIFEFQLTLWTSNSQILLAWGTFLLVQVFKLINNLWTPKCNLFTGMFECNNLSDLLVIFIVWISFICCFLNYALGIF